MKKLVLLLSVLVLVSCKRSPEQEAKFQKERQERRQELDRLERTNSYFVKGKRQLETMGYTDVKPMSYPLYCCTEDDSFWASVGFSAKDKDGVKVEGCFCVPQGLTRNSVTIRFK